MSKRICADGMYNLTVQGFPFLLCETTCKDHQYHPLCIVISKRELESDYAYIFETNKSTL